MEWFIKKMDEMDAHTLYDILELRMHVFIIEQQCFYEELDRKDHDATHVYAKDDSGKIVAYLRVLGHGVSFDEVSIGRVVVHPEARKDGLGRMLMRKGIEVVKTLYGDTPIRISAQAYLQKFYESIGFEAVSEIYLEDDIPHLDMIRDGDRALAY